MLCAECAAIVEFILKVIRVDMLVCMYVHSVAMRDKSKKSIKRMAIKVYVHKSE
jgi:hypothetical protein